MSATDRPAVVAVDGGASKTDAAVVDAASGAVLGRHRGPGCSHHQIGLAAAVRAVDSAVGAALGEAGVDPARVVHAGCYLAAVDLPDETAALSRALAVLPWARGSLVVENDVFALLRAGTAAPDAAVVVCGTGINGAAVRSDGATARVLSLGRVSGDWGGGSGLAEEVLWHAARAEDGRGRPTALRAALLRWTGAGSVAEISAAVHQGRLTPAAWWDRTPEVFALAVEGDEVSVGLVERQGEEIGVLAVALLTRLDLDRASVPVVLGGGIATAGDARLDAAVRRTLRAGAPQATVTGVSAPPIDGAVALCLEHARRPADEREDRP